MRANKEEDDLDDKNFDFFVDDDDESGSFEDEEMWDEERDTMIRTLAMEKMTIHSTDHSNQMSWIKICV